MSPTDSNDPTRDHSKAWLFTWECAGSAFIFLLMCALIIWLTMSGPLALALLCVGLGCLLIPAKLSTNCKAVLGMILGVIGYVPTLVGTFHPVGHVEVVAYAHGLGGKEIAVVVDQASCQFAPKVSTLTCNAQVGPKN